MESPTATHFYLHRTGSWEQQEVILVSGISTQHHLLVSREPFLPKESSLIKDQGKEHMLQLLAEFMLLRVMPLLRAWQTQANSTQHFILKVNKKTSTESCLCALVFCRQRESRILEIKINEYTYSVSGYSLKSPY